MIEIIDETLRRIIAGASSEEGLLRYMSENKKQRTPSHSMCNREYFAGHVDPSQYGRHSWPQSLSMFPVMAAENNSLADMILEEPHTLIAGTTGSGKSVLIHSVLSESLLRHPYNAQLILIDLKKVELFPYSKIPFRCMAYASEPGEVEKALEMAVLCVRNRIRTMQEQGIKKSKAGHVYVVVDELADMIQTCSNSALENLITIGRLGRCANVHFIAATQSPNRRCCPAELAQNATLRIGLRCQTGIESRQIINQAGAELLPRYGEALVLKDGYVIRRCIPMVSDEEINARIEFLSRKTAYKDGATGKVILDATNNV